MAIKDRINIFRMILRAAERDAFGPRHVLDAIEESAAKLAPIDADEDVDGETAADIGADQMNGAEHLLGAAFVVVQGCMTDVVSRMARLHALAEKRGVKLATTNGARKELLAFGASERPSRIEIVEAAANYYKHSPEWPAMWKDPDKRQARTIEVMRELGAASTSHANLIGVTSSLGGGDFHTRATLYDDIFANWRRDVVTAYRAEIDSLGLR